MTQHRKCTRLAVLAVAVFALLGLGSTAADASPTSTPSSTAWSMSPPAAPGHIHPDGWVGACAGEFYQVQVVNGYLEWGGEQSCTNSYEQSLQMLLTAANGDFVDNVYQSKVGNQIALHRSTRCLTLNATTYHEFAYGIANGQQGNPYPAANYFTVNCYIPAEDDGCGANATPAGAPQLAADRPADTAVITATHGGNRPSC